MSAAIKLSSPASHEFWEIPVLFEDEHLLALDKPAGLLSSPDGDAPEQPSLMKLLHDGIAAGKPWARERNLVFLANAQRLDSEIGGVFLLAKNKSVLVSLTNLFGSEKPFETYIALVHGQPLEDQFEVDAKLAPHPVKPGLMCVDSKRGRKSKTQFVVLEKFNRWALLQCRPLTSRPHQIRVHLRHAGPSVAGDRLYSGKPLWLSSLKPGYRIKPGHEERPMLSQPALHATDLNFIHPVTGATITVTSPWPKDLRVAVKYLRQFAK